MSCVNNLIILLCLIVSILKTLRARDTKYCIFLYILGKSLDATHLITNSLLSLVHIIVNPQPIY